MEAQNHHSKPKQRFQQRRNPVVKKKVLPIEFMDNDKREIMARYDNGAYGNHMSLTLATTMGYELDRKIQPSSSFPMESRFILSEESRRNFDSFEHTQTIKGMSLAAISTYTTN